MTANPAPAAPHLMLGPVVRERLEATLRSAAASSVPWLDATSARLLTRPGKRLRPALVFAAAACGSRPDPAATLTCAVAVELLHQSSLIHDDLLDGADHRGGALTVHATDGPAAAVLAGDYLLGAGGRLVCQVGGRAAGIWHEAYAAMCEGQARETSNRYMITTVDEYLLTIRGKTAALMRAACLLGGLCAGVDEAALSTLGTFGESFGMLFQIVDDVMDMLSTPALWGKQVQHDVGQGVFTLPVLLAAQAPGSPLPQILTAHPLPASIDAVYQTVRDLAVGPAMGVVYEWADRARSALDPLPRSVFRDDLAGMGQRYVTAVFPGRVAMAHQPIVDPYLRHDH